MKNYWKAPETECQYIAKFVYILFGMVFSVIQSHGKNIIEEKDVIEDTAPTSCMRQTETYHRKLKETSICRTTTKKL